MTARRGILVLAGVFTAALALPGCSADPQSQETGAPVTTSVATSPAPSPADTPTQAAAELTCEAIIPEGTVADFAEVGWTAKSESFRAGSIELEDGIMCTWGDYSVATDHVQIYGWAPIDQRRTEEAIGELVGSGWRREDAPEGVYVTESEDTAIATDSEGYGLTYLFGDGWVEMADTKQGLLLVEWPPA